ncbi:hypothetical protein QWY28_16455 [Nocardioides sp. SOB77]|uniref:DUF4386 family protein n=1 Tax=Nocardioides oceani TaxID=3058369 RepID=A0ABT8FIX0_9ACTN|nr:hypothetical protein [Nocardioides oceani]MDN4174554.1 hypothetical protein [Nocardioides oceani]
MRSDWLPVSAALLVTGAMALALATLVGDSGGSTSETLRSVENNDGRWLAVAVIYLLASACLTLGLPTILYVLQDRSRFLGGLGVISLALGFIGLAGYGMLVTFFRALVITDAIRGPALRAAAEESGLTVVLYGWVVAFVLGELLVTLALLRVPEVPRWVPAVLAAHLVAVALGGVLPDAVTRAAVLLLALGFAGIAITAALPDPHRRSLARA